MNRVVHFEIHARDIEKVRQFYSDVFDWDIKNMGPDMGNYHMVMTGVDEPGAVWIGINGGITPRNGNPPTGDEAVNAFVCTIQVNNIDEYTAKVEQAGGSISLGKMDVPGVGWLVYCKDVEGNIFGMLEPHPGEVQTGEMP